MHTRPATTDSQLRNEETMTIDLTSVYAQSDEVAAKAIDDEFMIVPVSKSARRAEAIFLLNDTGREIWERLNGDTPLEQVVEAMVKRYNTVSTEQIHQDIWQLVQELSDRNVIKRVKET